MDNAQEHLDLTSELSLGKIKEKAIKGVIALTGRTFILQIVALAANFLLTIYLNPAQYGTFFLVSAVISFFAYFSDIGLAAALIQKKENVTQEDLKTTFTIQQCLVITLVVVIFVLTPFFKSWYHLSDDAIYLMWALTLSLFLSSLKTIPSVLLERHLEFNKLIIPQIFETLIFYTTAVVLAIQGWGIMSFTIAVVLRGISGLIVMYLVSPWKPGLAYSKNSLRVLFKFGLPYQANTFLAMVKDDGMTIFLGGILGTSGIGFLGWANKWGSAPLRFFMDQVIKVTFPAFARIQHDSKELSNLVSKSIFFITALVFPSLVLLAILAPLLTVIIPKYEKWQPALLALVLITINSAWAAVSTPLTNTLSAIGKVTITFKLMIMWTILTWLIIPALAYVYGVNGAALGFTILGFSSIVAIVVAIRYVKINFWESVEKPLLASVVMGIAVFLIERVLPTSILTMVLLVLLGLVIYGVIMVCFLGVEKVKNTLIQLRDINKKVA